MLTLDYNKMLVECARQKVNLTDIFKKAHVSVAITKKVREGKGLQPKIAGRLADALGVDVADIQVTQ